MYVFALMNADIPVPDDEIERLARKLVGRAMDDGIAAMERDGLVSTLSVRDVESQLVRERVDIIGVTRMAIARLQPATPSDEDARFAFHLLVFDAERNPFRKTIEAILRRTAGSPGPSS